MDLLLDTNALLWALAGDRRLGRARPIVADPRNAVYVSAASAWEIAIKVGLGKLRVPPQTWQPGCQQNWLPCDARHSRSPSNTPWRSNACHGTTPIPSTGCSSPRPPWRG